MIKINFLRYQIHDYLGAQINLGVYAIVVRISTKNTLSLLLTAMRSEAPVHVIMV